MKFGTACDKFHVDRSIFLCFVPINTIERMLVLFVKQRSSVSEPPFDGLGGNVCDSSLARWKDRSRFSMGYN